MKLDRACWIVIVALCLCAGLSLVAKAADSGWRTATDRELASLLPARALVVKEHIETEMRTASGITDGHGHFVAGVVLITAGYAADGKYSHYLVVQTPLQLDQLTLRPGEYALGWQRGEDALHVHLYEAATGNPAGDVEARRIEGQTRVESFKIWPPGTKSIIQIGRFAIPYKLRK